MYFLVVADGPESRLAERLISSMERTGTSANYWTNQMFKQHRARVVGHTRVLFLGNGPFAPIMRSTVTPSFDSHGVRWGAKRRMGFVWTDDVVLDKQRTWQQLGVEIEQAAVLANTKRALGRDAGMATGAMIAHQLLSEQQAPSALRLTGRRFDEEFTRRQLFLGIAHMLLHGYDAWLEVALTPAMSSARLAGPAPAPFAASTPRQPTPGRPPVRAIRPTPRPAPPRTSQTPEMVSSGYVEYSQAPVLNPNASAGPAPLRRVGPQQGGTTTPSRSTKALSSRDLLVSELGELSVALAEARVASKEDPTNKTAQEQIEKTMKRWKAALERAESLLAREAADS